MGISAKQNLPFIFSALLAAVLILASCEVLLGFTWAQVVSDEFRPATGEQTRCVDGNGTDEKNDCLIFNNPCTSISHSFHAMSVSDLIVVDAGIYKESFGPDNFLPLQSAGKSNLQNKIYFHDGKNIQNVLFKNRVHLAILGLILILSLIKIRRRIPFWQPGSIKQPKTAGIQTSLQFPQIEGSSEEKAFIKKLNTLIEQQISDERFNVEMLACEMNMSSRNLRRKTRLILGESPVAILRRCRLERARKMLSRNTDNVSQIAYQCGFSDPGYFSRCFRLEYGTLPSQYKAA